MGMIAYELIDLYQRYFGKKPVISGNMNNGSNYTKPFDTPSKSNQIETISKKGSLLLAQDNYNTDIWLPITLYELPNNIGSSGVVHLLYGTVKISGDADIIKTPLIERRGSAKELYSIGDYQIELKGFFIDKENRTFPEDDIIGLKQIFELGQAFSISNAIINCFLQSSDKVVMKSFDLPEVSGGRKHVKPYSIKLESDSVFTLEVE